MIKYSTIGIIAALMAKALPLVLQSGKCSGQDLYAETLFIMLSFKDK